MANACLRQSKKRPIHPQSQSSFLSLPTELRNRIYGWVLFKNPDGNGKTLIVRHGNRTETSPSVLTLLETCRQVYFDAEGLFYGINELEFLISTFYLFSHQFNGSPRLHSIRKLTINGLPANYISEIICKIMSLKHLESLHILASLPQRPVLNPRMISSKDFELSERALNIGKACPHLKKIRITYDAKSDHDYAFYETLVEEEICERLPRRFKTIENLLQ